MSEDLTSDVVVVGSGVAGAVTAHRLAAAGLSVLILEAGPRVDRGEAAERFRASLRKSPLSPYPMVAHAPSPDSERLDAYYLQDGPTTFEGLYLRVLGGTTWHWGGNASRLLPNDMRMRSAYGVALDWPLDYAELTRFYDAAERELGVAGDVEACLVPPGRGPFPLPPIPPTYLDRVVARAASPLGLTLKTFPQARNSRDYDDRPPCCGSATCVPLCPIGAKYDASVHVGKAEEAGARVVTEAVVHRIELDAQGRVAALRFLRPDRTEGIARGRAYVLAAHAIETPKLLLMSKGERAPQGVANRSGQVGRNLMGHVQVGFVGLAAEPVYPYRGPVETSGFAEFRDGEFRREHAAMGSGLSNQGWIRAIGPQWRAGELIGRAGGPMGAALRAEFARQMQREVAVGGSAEVLPDPENRIMPDETQRDSLGLPRPRIRFRLDDYTLRSLERGQERHQRVMAALGCTDVLEGPPRVNTSIIVGTARMGTEPAHSVVDPELRAHDHPNLFIVGSAAFPTAGISPPTLTIAALAIRAAESIRRQLA